MNRPDEGCRMTRTYVLDSDDDEQTWFIQTPDGQRVIFPAADGELLARMLNDTFRDGAAS